MRAPRVALLAALVGCGSGGFGGSGGSSVSVEPSGHPLDAADFDFCHRPRELTRAERRWCPLVDAEAAERCPGLAQSCEAAQVDPPARGCAASGGGASSSGPSATPPKPPLESWAADGLGAVLRWTVALFVALALVGVLAIALRLFGTLRRRPANPPSTPEPAAVVHAAPDEPIELLHEADTLIEQAQRALSEGRFDQAVLLARGAALRGLADREVIRLHPSRTDREYVRAARANPEASGGLREIVAAVEEVRWGRLPTASERARAVVAAAARLAAASMIALVLGLAPARGAEEHEPDGLAAFAGLIAEDGVTVRTRFRPLRLLDGHVDVLIVDAEQVWIDDESWDAIDAWVAQGGTLLLLGLPEAVAQRFDLDGTSVPSGARIVVHRPSIPVPVWPDRPRLGLRPERTTATPLVSAALPTVDAQAGDDDLWLLVEFLSMDGSMLVLPDPAVLRNAALVRPENLAFAEFTRAWLLEPLDGVGRVEIVAFPIVDAPSNPAESLRNARLLPLVLQGLALLALAAIWRGVPFGRPRDPPSDTRRDLAEHARALGEHYRALRATRHVAAAQAALWLDRVGVVGLQRAAELHGYTPERARELVDRLRALADAPDAPDAPSDLATLEELWTIVRPT